MEVNIKRIQMSCNVSDPLQKMIYDKAKDQSNSSWYLKSLVLNDLYGQQHNPVQETQKPEEHIDLNSFI